MELNITFAWHLDGPSFPEETAVGRLVVGPIGLLHQLCLRLGLTTRFPEPSIRIARYISRLREVDDGQQFFSKSFATDPWGTAKALLRLRDELKANGFKFQIDETSLDAKAAFEETLAHSKTPLLDLIGNASSLDQMIEAHYLNRLRAFCRLEKLNGESLECISDRMIDILDRLQEIDALPINSITLLDDFNLLPPVWQKLLQVVEKKRVNVRFRAARIKTSVDQEHSAEEALSDVEKLALLFHDNEARPFNGDGSIVVLESDDEVQAADCIASILQSVASKGESIVFIRGSSTSFIDHLLKKSNLPRLGGVESSPMRGYLSLLPLTLELMWQPFDPKKMIEFLMLPLSPVPPSISRRFIEALKSEPGIGGSAWQRAWQKTIEFKRQLLLQEQGAKTQLSEAVLAVIEDLLKTFEQALRVWLEPEQYDTENGMPASIVLATCERVKKHANVRLNVATNLSLSQLQVFIRASIFADTLAATVRDSKLDPIPRSQLLRLIESSIGDGYSPENPDASPWIPVDHPGQIIDHTHTIVWWGFVDSKQHAKTNPWTVEELNFLSEQDVHLENPRAMLVREAKSWRRAVDALPKRLIFVKPRTVAGRTVAAHPFFHEVAEAIEASPHAVRQRILRQADQIYSQPEIEILGEKLSRTTVRPRELPGPRPIWKINQGVLPTAKHSASSIERLLGCPMSWLLKYHARLEYGHTLSTTEGERLSGILAHAVFALIFGNDDWLQSSDIEHQASVLFDRLCPQIAAPLLLPGSSLERQRLKKSICDGARTLSMLIKEAGFSKVYCEVDKSATIDDIDFAGRLDMVLMHPDNRDFVIDFKWTRRPTYRRREIAEGRAIQLALYTSLLKSETGKSAEAGYYMISQGQLLATTKAPFPDHTYIEGPTLNETSRKIVSNVKTHFNHLQQGTVYATGLVPEKMEEWEDFGLNLISDDDAEISAAKIPDITLSLEPPCRICEFGRLCGKKGYDE